MICRGKGTQKTWISLGEGWVARHGQPLILTFLHESCPCRLVSPNHIILSKSILLSHIVERIGAGHPEYVLLKSIFGRSPMHGTKMTSLLFRPPFQLSNISVCCFGCCCSVSSFASGWIRLRSDSHHQRICWRVKHFSVNLGQKLLILYCICGVNLVRLLCFLPPTENVPVIIIILLLFTECVSCRCHHPTLTCCHVLLGILLRLQMGQVMVYLDNLLTITSTKYSWLVDNARLIACNGLFGRVIFPFDSWLGGWWFGDDGFSRVARHGQNLVLAELLGLCNPVEYFATTLVVCAFNIVAHNCYLCGFLLCSILILNFSSFPFFAPRITTFATFFVIFKIWQHLEHQFRVFPQELNTSLPFSLSIGFLVISKVHFGRILGHSCFAESQIRLHGLLFNSSFLCLKLVAKDTFLRLHICHNLAIVNLFGALFELLDRQLFQFGHNVVQAFLVDESASKARSFVKQEVNVYVVQNVCLQSLLQLLLLLLTQLLEIASLFHQFGRLVKCSRRRHTIYGWGCGIFGRWAQKVNHF